MCGLLFVAAVPPKLVKIKTKDGITVSIPKDWHPMDQYDIVQRYPSVRAPLLAYTNEERVIDYSVNISATQWPDDDAVLAQKFFKAGVVNMFDRVEIISEGVQEIHGKKFIFFEFESRMNGNRRQEGMGDPVLRYTYIQYLIIPGKTLVFSFNCPRSQKEAWQETAKLMMKSIRVKI